MRGTSDKPTFLGYHREDGSVGVRNHVLVLSITGLTGPTARRIGSCVPGAKVVSMPYGSGLVGDDYALHRRAMIGLACNPNVGAVVLIGGHPPFVAECAKAIAESGKPVEAITLDECSHDALMLSDRAVKAVVGFMRTISGQRRQKAPLSSLFVAGECGRSDPSSGVVANPLVGRLIDAVVIAGGRAVFGETMEWYGATHLLHKRAVNDQVIQDIDAAVERRLSAARDAGIDLLGENPGPTNIEAGLSTLEEKALGSIVKGGSQPIQGLLSMAEQPPGQGLWLMDAPAYAPESLTAMTAAGAQLNLFTTGPGNSFVSLLAPTIKISANPDAVSRIPHHIDFDAHRVFIGRQSIESAAHALLHMSLEVASGRLTCGEILNEGEEVISRLGPAL